MIKNILTPIEDHQTERRVSSYKVGPFIWNCRYDSTNVQKRTSLRLCDLPRFYGIVIFGLMIGVWRVPKNRAKESFVILAHNSDGVCVGAIAQRDATSMPRLTTSWDDARIFTTWYKADTTKSYFCSDQLQLEIRGFSHDGELYQIKCLVESAKRLKTP